MRDISEQGVEIDIRSRGRCSYCEVRSDAMSLTRSLLLQLSQPNAASMLDRQGNCRYTRMWMRYVESVRGMNEFKQGEVDIDEVQTLVEKSRRLVTDE